MWVQWDVAVGAELPERHVQPVRGADLHDRVDGQIEELALAKTGPGEELDREPGERVRVLTRGAQQLRGRGVVDEPAGAADRGVGCHRRTSARASGASSPSHSLSRSRHTRSVPSCSASADASTAAAAADRWPLREVTLVALDVSASEIADRSDLWGVRGQPDGELAQDGLDADHRRGP